MLKLDNGFSTLLSNCIPPIVIFFGLLSIWPHITHAAKTIRIASIYSLSGPAAGANSPSVQGVHLAVQEINAAGGILGMPLEILEFDNLSTPIGSKVAADNAAQKEVTAIIGAAFSSHSMAVAKVAQAHGIPMITNISTSPAVTRIGNYIFRACFDDSFQGKVMGEFARRELKAKNVVGVFDMASDYSLGLTRSFEKAFVQWGGVMLAKIPYKSRQPHFRDIISKAISLNPDALFIAGHDESARIIREAIQTGLNAIPMGCDGWDAKSFYDLGGKNLKTGYYATHWSQEESDTALSKAFVERYRHLGMITAPTALAYDSVMLLKNAIERAGTIQCPAIRDALAQTRGYEGVTGSFSFNNHGDPIKNVVIMKIESGLPVYLKKIVPENGNKTVSK
jgi:branched-chain amino acid transport system substrate-binding protein